MKRASNKNYEQVCHDLGMRPEIQFVEITNRGTITFTVGKPEEIRSLLDAVERAGYIPAKSLVDRARKVGYQSVRALAI
jgi:hypothetical protein